MMRTLTQPDARALAKLGRALGHEVRMQLLAALRSGPARLFELRAALNGAGVPVQQSDVTYHLGELADVGLVERAGPGRRAPYRLSKAGQIVLTSFLGGAR